MVSSDPRGAVGSDLTRTVDFDSASPVPVDAYELTVKGVNVGYEVFLALAHSLLRSLNRSNLQVLVVGAGGGAEIETFLPNNPGWHLTGVDPSRDMLALAHRKAEHLDVGSRVRLVRGTIETLPADAAFDAATCLFVLHFLADDAKRTLLQEIRRRVRPGAPVFVASGGRMLIDESLRADVLGTWQQHGQLAGLPAERMAAIIDGLLDRQVSGTSETDYLRLFGEAGFASAAPVMNMFNGGLLAWILR